MVNIAKAKALAKEKGMKIKYICAALGHSEVYLNDVARGRTTMSEEKIRALAAILMTSYEYLTDRTEDPSPREDWVVDIDNMMTLGATGSGKSNSINKTIAKINKSHDSEIEGLQNRINELVSGIEDKAKLEAILRMLEAFG